MTPDTLLMNPHTGTVQTADDWAADGYTQDNAELVPVTKTATGWESTAELTEEKP